MFEIVKFLCLLMILRQAITVTDASDLGYIASFWPV